uniref:K-box domain-containing protein n=1 Tax=Oryza brachyantha TaxID=4533 RepID=J3MDX8_ORYBR
MEEEAAVAAAAWLSLVRFWQAEAERLREELHNLQANHRQLLGQNLSGLDVNDLKDLENQLGTSLLDIRVKKDQILVDQIEELKRKESIMHNENVELKHELNTIRQEKVNLHRKVYGKQELNAGQSSVTMNSTDDEKEIRLELSQPQVAGNKQPKATEFRGFDEIHDLPKMSEKSDL